MTLDYENIERKLERMEESYHRLLTYREDVRELRKAGEEWTEKGILQSAVENELRVCCQVAVDIAKAIMVLEGWVRRREDENELLIIGEKGVLPKEFAGRFKGVKNLRNLIIHEYLEIDYKKLADNMEQAEDFEEFSRYIAAYLRKKLASSDEIASP